MTIADLCRNDFFGQDMGRGDAYFHEGRVELQGFERDLVTANVEGSYGQAYGVLIDLATNDPERRYACTCPRFEDGYNCKHVWATLLACDADDLASQLQRRTAARSKPGRNGKKTLAKKLVDAPWRKRLQAIHEKVVDRRRNWSVSEQLAAVTSEYLYVLSLADHVDEADVKIGLFERQLKVNGEWGIPTPVRMSADDIQAIESRSDDGLILSLLKPNFDVDTSHRFRHYFPPPTTSQFTVPPAAYDQVWPLLASTNRFVWSLSGTATIGDARPVTWDADDPGSRAEWSTMLKLHNIRVGRKQMIELLPELRRNGEVLDLAKVTFAFAEGLVLIGDTLSRLRTGDAAWIQSWQANGSIQFPKKNLDAFLDDFANLAGSVDVEFDESLAIESARGVPQPMMALRDSRDVFGDAAYLAAKVSMKYGAEEIALDSTRGAFWDQKERRWTTRDFNAESARLAELSSFPRRESDDVDEMRIHRKWLPKLVQELVPTGWEIVAHGTPMRLASGFSMSIASGTDWFDLNASADFGGVSASLPTLLAALKKKQDYVVLDDGSHGMLPEAWLKQYGGLAEMGVTNGDSVRFSKPQALLLDVMLAEQDGVSIDRDFTRYCKKLAAFDGIKPAKEPRGFRGELRPYQRDGLGWIGFLRDFEFGGCLADDMGLGKTVQVLAMLQSRRNRRLKSGETRRPSIAIVPKSLIFNWTEEAARFAPKLSVRNYTGPDRWQEREQLGPGDLLVTTYGTLLRDIGSLRDVEFDYAILDEAQAIKNPNSQSAKACRLLQANHRLVMTGTPVENHLGDLWSLFEFLNPGMLGNSAAFRNLAAGGTERGEIPDASSLSWLADSLRPFILRRTKEQVLTELPEKMEQTLYCEMNPKQAKLYGELRDHYRAHIGKKVDELGIKRSKIHVLEALLRLRQSACDPRLVDKDQRAEGAKIALLVEQLEEVMSEGHKALIFSQFTSMLSLVRDELDNRGWSYAYLDGKSRRRGEIVRSFQEDDSLKLFLISLKAGGHGLNLTAADYVYILDPWWNPAAEAQAIDRAHRIGQERPVMAYRIICRDTVEDKIVQLQQSKRNLADAIITANESLIRELSIDDLQMLFG